MALILDTGPLFASLDRNDQHHPACRALLERATEPLIVPSPVLVEVDYWVRKWLGAGALVALMDDILAGAYAVENLVTEDYRRVSEVCDRYADADLGFVDAAVLAIAERLNEPKLATLDRRHFCDLGTWMRWCCSQGNDSREHRLSRVWSHLVRLRSGSFPCLATRNPTGLQRDQGTYSEHSGPAASMQPIGC